MKWVLVAVALALTAGAIWYAMYGVAPGSEGEGAAPGTPGAPGGEPVQRGQGTQRELTPAEVVELNRRAAVNHTDFHQEWLKWARSGMRFT